MTEWVVDLYDYATRSYMGTLDGASNRSISPAKSAEGAFSLDLSLFDDLSGSIKNHSTYVQARRNGAIRFEGKITNNEKKAKQGIVSINCLGWWEIVKHRFVRGTDPLVFTNKSLGEIAWYLLAHSQTYDGDLGFIVGPSQTAGFVVPSYTVPVDANIGEIIDRFTQVENGIEFKYNYSTRIHEFSSASTPDKPDAEFGFNKGPANLDDISEVNEGSRKVNRIKVISSTSNNFVVVSNDVSIAESGTYMEVESLTGIAASVSEQNVLNAYGTDATFIRGSGVTTYRCTVLNPEDDGAPDDLWIPRPWDDFDISSKIRLSCDAGSFQLDKQQVVAWSFTVNIDDAGNEILASLEVSK